MIEIQQQIQKYKIVLILLGLALLVAIILLVTSISGRRTQKIPLRGVFVDNSCLYVQEVNPL